MTTQSSAPIAVNAGACELESPLGSTDLQRLRGYRLGRVQLELHRQGCAGAVLFDPSNIRYATGSRNMAVWTLHNPVRCAFVPTAGLPIVFEFGAGRWPVEAEALETVGEVRPVSGWTHFYAGTKKHERVARWATDIAELVAQHGGGETRVAFDGLSPMAADALRARGIVIADGEALLERARLIKSAEELKCIRHSVAVADLAMHRMRSALAPGLRENELWSVLHQTNIAHNGEWIETRLLSSGERTNPWMQECGERVIQAGDVVAFDTDLIGPNGYCADISRTFVCGLEPVNVNVRRHYRAAYHQIQHNCGLFKAGRTLREVVENEWPFPEEFLPYRYGLAHGVGLKDEYPFLPNRADIHNLSDPDQLLEVGMVFSVESYIGEVGGSFGIKLEEQIIVGEDGPEFVSNFPFEESLL